MNARAYAPTVFCVGGLVFVLALATGARNLHADTEKRPAQEVRWTKVSVDLPSSETIFPPGPGAQIANGQCLICHSAGMVLRQPPLTQTQWAIEIEKMRTAYGAPLPADQVQALAEYLHGINGTKPNTEPSQ